MTGFALPIRTLWIVILIIIFSLLIARDSEGEYEVSEPIETPYSYVEALSIIPTPTPTIAGLAPKRAGVSRKVMNADNALLGQNIASQRGITGLEWDCLNRLWGNRESGWNNLAQNPTSSAFGIAQFLDSTWKGTGYLKSSDPGIQIEAGIVYIKNRYGTSCKALSHSLTKNWY